ncbi:thiosulfate oxidation carrier protein SoxY [Stappia taiwanensis]|uniref:Thiosulfate oxidation carrier protein SoxY n=1 Tax=Stappia taiwanensis TaxID=992267 RepID=A0A838XS01_9HYPH|nr:thiosulfate oxidation carrier protein SoxY [Stappia taiwanensis]MBA4613215.1 thiosulfate oxidation carrier protein SoxY [Stappia taiwanensis]GGE79439.1 thiosulfate oxidation carrier protein SoxY [Stappia taiwanensis]
MNITRRQALALGAGAAVVTMTALPRLSLADTDAVKAAIDAVAGGATPEVANVTLTAPEIAENGNTVPITVAIDSPMTDDDYVTDVTILAAGNPAPGVATFHFTPMSGSAEATTRMRLAKTQDVIAVAKTSTGKVYMDRKTVKVTIGGCGG